MSEIKLLPCPFCGGEAELYEQKHREYASTYYVRCKGCHCKSIERMGEGIVIEAWNTRKPVDDIVEQLRKEKEMDRSKVYSTAQCTAIRFSFARAIDIVRSGGKE